MEDSEILAPPQFGYESKNWLQVFLLLRMRRIVYMGEEAPNMKEKQAWTSSAY